MCTQKKNHLSPLLLLFTFVFFFLTFFHLHYLFEYIIIQDYVFANQTKIISLQLVTTEPGRTAFREVSCFQSCFCYNLPKEFVLTHRDTRESEETPKVGTWVLVDYDGEHISKTSYYMFDDFNILIKNKKQTVNVACAKFLVPCPSVLANTSFGSTHALKSG